MIKLYRANVIFVIFLLTSLFLTGCDRYTYDFIEVNEGSLENIDKISAIDEITVHLNDDSQTTQIAIKELLEGLDWFASVIPDQTETSLFKSPLSVFTL